MTFVGLLKSALALSIFVSGCLAIVLTQLVFTAVSFGNREFLHGRIAWTKQLFIVLLITTIRIVSKTDIKVSITTERGSFAASRLSIDSNTGLLHTKLPSNTVIFANHQIYTDWLFLWWWSFTAGLSGYVYIILKASLRKIPLLGYGMQNYRFIFLTRKWLKDKFILSNGLELIDANARGKGEIAGHNPKKEGELEIYPEGVDHSKKWPYSLVIFPEGTNLSPQTRKRSEAYAQKVGKPTYKHVLLPRSTGLRYVLSKLQGTVNEVVDVTLAYSGVTADQYGQDVYRLAEVFLRGKNPERVDFHIRTFKIDEIPTAKAGESEIEEAKNAEIFENWLYKVWDEKDRLMDSYYKTGRFQPLDPKEEFNTIETEIAVPRFEFLNVYVIPIVTLLTVRMFIQLYYYFLNSY